jgi:hypothetical protein
MLYPDLPHMALSVRQPWAWSILHAGKPVENRDWSPRNPGLAKRGTVCLHASACMTRKEYGEARQIIWSLGITNLPMFENLQRGGIVGTVTIVDVVRQHSSKWFFGPIGLVLENPQPVEFIEVKGALGFFNWRRNLEDRP